MLTRQSSFVVFLTTVLVVFTFFSIAKAQNFLYPMDEVRKDLREAARQAFERTTTLTPKDAFTVLQRLKMVGEAYFKKADPDLAKELAKRGGVQFVVSLALDIGIDVLIEEMAERGEFSKWGANKDLVRLWAKVITSGLMGGPIPAAISAAYDVHDSWKETKETIKALPPDAPMDANLRYLYEIIIGTELMKKEKPYLSPMLSVGVMTIGITMAVAEQAKIIGLHRLTTGMLPLLPIPTAIKIPYDASQLSQRIVGYVNNLDNVPPQLINVSITSNSISFTFNEPMRTFRKLGGATFHVTTSGFSDPVSEFWSIDRKTFTIIYGTTSPSGSTLYWAINPDPNIPPWGKFSDLSSNPAPATSGSLVIP